MVKKVLTIGKGQLLSHREVAFTYQLCLLLALSLLANHISQTHQLTNSSNAPCLILTPIRAMVDFGSSLLDC